MIAKLFFTFAKIGFLGFGGGYAMLSLIFDESAKFGMTIREFADLNALDILIPGPIAINSATYVGQLYGGFGGAFMATLAVSLPSLVFVPLFLKYERAIKNNRYLNSILSSVKMVSVGLVFGVALSIALSTILNVTSLFNWQGVSFDLFSLVIMALTLFIHLRWDINPLVLILAAGLLGWLVYYL